MMEKQLSGLPEAEITHVIHRAEAGEGFNASIEVDA